MQESATFGPEFESVRSARQFVRDVLERWRLEDREPPASVLVTELCSNSVLHARGAFTVSLTSEENVLRIAVRDSSRRLPAEKSHSQRAMTGRGLLLVDAYSDEWGVELHQDGKTVWASLVVRTGSAGGRSSASRRAEATAAQARRAPGAEPLGAEPDADVDAAGFGPARTMGRAA